MRDDRERTGRGFARQTSFMATLLALLALLAGCSGGGGGDEPTPTASPQPTAEPTATPAMSLGEVQWATETNADGSPAEAIEAFPRDAPVIYALVDAQAIPQGEVLTATWTIDDTPIDGATSSVTIDAAGSGWASFSLTWSGDALWPVGTLGVTITASSGATTTGAILIEST